MNSQQGHAAIGRVTRCARPRPVGRFWPAATPPSSAGRAPAATA